jgi:hypothetical protein
VREFSRPERGPDISHQNQYPDSPRPLWAGQIRNSRGGYIAIERRGGNAEMVRDLGDADIGIGRYTLAASMSSSSSFGGRPPVRPARGAQRGPLGCAPGYARM